jgi:hypothetical protein
VADRPTRAKKRRASLDTKSPADERETPLSPARLGIPSFMLFSPDPRAPCILSFESMNWLAQLGTVRHLAGVAVVTLAHVRRPHLRPHKPGERH